MNAAGVLACCLFSIPLVGTGRRADPNIRAKSLPTQTAQSAQRKGLQTRLVQGAQLFQAGSYEAAREQFESVREDARRQTDLFIELRATANVGGCWFALHQYKQAMGLFLEAQTLAQKSGDTNSAAALDANIASLYSEMGERDAAVAWLERSLAAWTGKERRAHLPQLDFEMAALRARQDRWKEARDLFQQGIAAADAAGDPALVAVGCNKFGEELLRAGRFEEAELPLLKAYYLRRLHRLRLHRLPLEGSYTNLGRLRLAQGDVTAASALLDLAVELSRRPGAAMPTWDAYLARGDVHLAEKNFSGALADLRIAVRLARAWRWSLPADDASRVGAEGLLDRIYSDLVEAGNQLYLQTANAALLRETFEANEENRALSLRMLVQSRQEQISEFPAAYWEALSRLQRAEATALRSGDGRELMAARAEYIRTEASASPAMVPPRPISPRTLRAALDVNTALLSVRLGDVDSWVWAADREGLTIYRLPSRSKILPLVENVTRMIRDNEGSGDGPRQLYQVLFGKLAERFRNRQHWLLALDPGLAGLPVAALQIESSPRPVYVVDRHVIQVIPGADYWLEASRKPNLQSAGLFLGVGDPIYNTADLRLPQVVAPPKRRLVKWALFAGTRQRDAGLSLPRLPGSGVEVDRCAREWKGNSVLLKGSEASISRVKQALQLNPEVVHFAVHFLESAPPRSHALMAFGLSNQREPELATPAEVAHWRTRAALVVLSGCDSSAGPALPGSGLMGLTRAWLSAGARAVLASRWATPDEDGALFAAFYREYGSGPVLDAAAALREAQIRMIREGGWRARPAYWAAWFVVGN